MKTALDFAIVILTVSMMFSVGLELETRHFRDLARNKRAFLAALIAQMVVLPAIGIFVVRTIPMPESLQMGILLLAACPVGDVANFYALLAREEIRLFRWQLTPLLRSSPVFRCR